MKMDMLQAINVVKDKAGAWRAFPRRVWAARRAGSKSFSPVLAVVRGFAKTALGIAAALPHTLRVSAPPILKGLASAVSGFLALLPAKVWLAAAGLIFAGLWLQEHDASVRAASELRQAGRQSAQRVEALEAQADAALRRANENNAAAIEQLEARRRALARQATNLAAQLGALREKQATQRAELDALPASALKRRLSDQLGPASVVRGPWSGLRGPSQGDGRTEAGSPAEAGNKAAAVGTPPLQPGAMAAKASAVGTPPLQPEALSRLTSDNGRQTTDNGQLTLSEAGARQVASALAERDACREQGAVQEKLFVNCNDRLAAGEAEIRTQADSLAKLNLALSAKDKILAEREAAWKAELRAARGTWRGRAWRAIKWIGAGVVVGQLIR